MRRAARIAAASVLFVSTRAFASLSDDAAAIERAAAELHGSVEHRQTVFIEENRVLQVSAGTAHRCRTVVIAGTRNVSFTILTAAPGDDVDDLLAELALPTSLRRRDSENGLVQIGGCDADATAIDRVFVRMASPRGALEIRVVAGSAVLPDLADALGRGTGPAPARGDPGPLLPVTSLSDRRQRVESAARAEGATSIVATETSADQSGIGDATLKAAVGCHRFTIIAEPIEAHAVMDVDAELHEKDTGALLARDRGETPDARLDACVGRPTEVSLVFAGAPPRSRVVIEDATFAIPAGIPEHFGDRARAALASSLRKRLRRGPVRGPIFETLGAQGAMATTMPVETGRCYVAGLSLVRGSSRGIRLVAQAAARASTEEVAQGVDATSLVFCADSSDRARIQVDAPGVALSWVLLVWPFGGEP